MTYFFIHTPKTSGTTFVDVLQKDTNNKVGYFYPPQREMELFEKRTKEGPLYHLEQNPDWKKYNFIVGHFTFGIHEIFKAENFSYLGVVRNPIDHYVSTYKALMRMPENFQNIILSKSKTFLDFLELDYTHNMQTFYLSGLSIKEIKENKEKAYQTAIENSKKYFSGVYPTERFDQGLFYFKNKIGIKPKLYLKKNVASNNISDKISEEIIEKISLINDVDIRLFNYFNEKFDAEYRKIPLICIETKMFKIMNSAYGLLK